ncbi:MAG: tetratricopeptide repeat protein [Acidimicrobiales bacterium]
MTPSRWEQIERLFEAAADLDARGQAAFLAEACGSDTELRAEVEALVAAERRSRSGAFISDPVQRAAEALAGDSDASRVGERVGPYRLVREIGRGGMGTVYLAERADAQYQASVAIKFARGGFAAPELERRFRAERQFLAGLTHPNIARLLDGGTTSEGTPYLVMELVEGEPIDVWCDRQGLGLDGRLALFQQTCAAVQHAHQALIVHRDLKPSNILVTADGTPKLVDFGIAKLLTGDEVADATTTIRLLTPAYSAPEQVRGGRITVATDVYALGGVLYRLVTGRVPLEVTGASAAEVERRVCEEDVPLPSTAATGPAGAWRRRLIGDLDTILLKALQKEPERRYASVERLGDDLRRHAEGRPVLARPDSLGYRAGKFVRRHRVGTVVAAAFVAVLVAFGAAMSVQAARVARERDATAEISRFLIGLFEVADPAQVRGDTVTAREILDSGAARIRSELARRPELEARLMSVMATAYQGLGLYARAMDLAREALVLRQTRFGDRHSAVAASLGQVAGLHYELGNLDSAVLLYERRLELTRDLYGSAHLEVATSLTDLAHALRARGDYPPAEQRGREAVELFRRVIRTGADSERTLLADGMSNLAQIYHFQGKLAAADSMYRASLELRRALRGDVHPDISESLNNLAGVLYDEGKLDEAETMYRDALALDERLYGPEHPNVSTDLVNVGRVLRARGDLAAAEAAVRRSIAIDTKLSGPTHWTVGYGLNQLAGLRFDQGDHVEAERLHRAALAVYDHSLPADNPYRVAPLLGVGNARISRGQAAAAEAPLRRALRIARASLPADHWLIADAESHLGGCLAALGRFAEAEPLVVGSYERLRAALSESDLRTRQARERLARFREATGRARGSP